MADASMRVFAPCLAPLPAALVAGGRPSIHHLPSTKGSNGPSGNGVHLMAVSEKRRQAAAPCPQRRRCGCAELVAECLQAGASADRGLGAGEGDSPDRKTQGLRRVDTGRALADSGHQTDTTTTKALQNGRSATSGDGDAGHEQDTSGQSIDTILHAKSATSVLRPCADPDLALIVHCWPGLPQSARAAVLRIVDDHTPQPQDRRVSP
jgi:hypothetical protein